MDLKPAAYSAIGALKAIPLRGQHLADLSPAREQSGELPCLLITKWAGLWLNRLSEVREDPGIKGICFCQPSG